MTKPMTPADIFEQLRCVPLFSEIVTADLQETSKQSHGIWKRKGSRIFEEGSAADCCFVLTAGRAKVVLSAPNDSEITLGMLEPFAVIGEIALLDRSTRTAGLVAVERSHFIAITSGSFMALRKNPAFEDRLVAHVTATLRRATEQLRAIYTYDSVDRVAWCLARLAHQRGRRVGGVITISPKPRHQELADMTGSSRETVSRVLVRLRQMQRLSWDKTALCLQVQAFKQYGADLPKISDV